MRRTAPALVALLLVPAALLGQDKDARKPPPPPCAPEPGRAVLRGTVVDSATALPLDGAGVELHWGADRAGVMRNSKEGETDHAGRFRMCDAPLDAPVVIDIRFWGSHVQRRVVQADTAQAPLDIQMNAPHSLLQGRVLDPSNQAVAGATVRLGGMRDVQITDEQGGFKFGRVPPGSYEVKVEHIAFTTVMDTLEVDFGSGVEATVHVAPGVIPLAPITVVVRSLELERNGFYNRQKYGHGTFVTRQQIEARHFQESADILARVTGVRLQPRRTGGASVATARAGCPMRFLVDGVRTSPTYSIDYVLVGDIEGVEIYLGPSQVPMEFSAFPGEVGGNCGLVVVWTRRNL